MKAEIIYQGGGHKVAGTRITIYDIVHYLEAGRSAAEIAEILRLSAEQVEVALRYIMEHKAEVMAVHREIEERIARGNPPEIEEKRKASRAKIEAWRRAHQPAKSQEGNGEGTPCRCEH